MANNQFAKGNPPNRTSFTSEVYGENHNCWKGGEQINKNDCTYINTGPNQRVRKPRLVYQQHHGTIPHNHIIIHLDGNRQNDDISNLKAISRAENMKRNATNH